MKLESSRRLRKSSKLRALIKETSLSTKDLIYPLFVKEGITEKYEMENMPDVYAYPLEEAKRQIELAHEKELGGIVLRPIPENYGDWKSVNKFQNETIKSLSQECSDLPLLVDGFFTSIDKSGFYGIKNENGELDYDKTIELLRNATLEQAEHGADVVLSLGRIDNAVAEMRDVLNQNGHYDIPILAYSANMASSLAHAMLIDPEVAEVHRQGFLNSKIGIGNKNEALRQIEMEVKQGADMIGFKPSLVSMDLINSVKQKYKMPTASYIVSKEYSMIKAAAERGYLDESETVLELSLTLKRAGSDNIMSYWALQQADWIDTFEF
jgi:porphobilinogen synthase